MAKKPVRHEPKRVKLEESRGAVKLPTNTNQNRLIDRYVKPPRIRGQ